MNPEDLPKTQPPMQLAASVISVESTMKGPAERVEVRFLMDSRDAPTMDVIERFTFNNLDNLESDLSSGLPHEIVPEVVLRGAGSLLFNMKMSELASGKIENFTATIPLFNRNRLISGRIQFSVVQERSRFASVALECFVPDEVGKRFGILAINKAGVTSRVVGYATASWSLRSVRQMISSWYSEIWDASSLEDKSEMYNSCSSRFHKYESGSVDIDAKDYIAISLGYACGSCDAAELAVFADVPF